MTTMIERVARALCYHRGAPACDCREKSIPCRALIDNLLMESNPIGYQARAAIEAMREPTQQMIFASDNAAADSTWQDETAVRWRAMIDAALNDRQLMDDMSCAAKEGTP